jgi:low temperature requirement protein LtrA
VVLVLHVRVHLRGNAAGVVQNHHPHEPLRHGWRTRYCLPGGKHVLAHEHGLRHQHRVGAVYPVQRFMDFGRREPYRALVLALVLNPGENPALERFGKRVVVFLAVQAALVLLSFAFPSVPAQVICLVAMLVGFASFASRLEKQIGKSHRSHLVERCALLIVLAFGEVVIGIGNSHEEGYSLLDAAFLLLLALGLFLVYLNQIENIVDEDKLGNGFAYIAVNAWLTFCIGNMTAAFEITNEGLSIGPLSGQAFMAIWVSAFLLSLFLFLPFSREFGDVHKRWIAARTAACVGVALVTLIVGNTPLAAIYETENSDGMADMPLYVLFYLVMLLGLLLVYLVLFIDKKMLSGHSQQSPTPNAK